jgi:hypothetical protein
MQFKGYQAWNWWFCWNWTLFLLRLAGGIKPALNVLILSETGIFS